MQSKSFSASFDSQKAAICKKPVQDLVDFMSSMTKDTIHDDTLNDNLTKLFKTIRQSTYRYLVANTHRPSMVNRLNSDELSAITISDDDQGVFSNITQPSDAMKRKHRIVFCDMKTYGRIENVDDMTTRYPHISTLAYFDPGSLEEKTITCDNNNQGTRSGIMQFMKDIKPKNSDSDLIVVAFENKDYEEPILKHCMKRYGMKPKCKIHFMNTCDIYKKMFDQLSEYKLSKLTTTAKDLNQVHIAVLNRPLNNPDDSMERLRQQYNIMLSKLKTRDLVRTLIESSLQ
jgi:hypothetical protein